MATRAPTPYRLAALLLGLAAAGPQAAMADALPSVVALGDPSVAREIGYQSGHVLHPADLEDLSDIPQRSLVIASPSALEGPRGLDVLDHLLQRQARVVVPFGLSRDAATGLGMALWERPPGAQELWREGPWQNLGWTPSGEALEERPAVVFGPPASLVDGAVWQPLLVAGRGRDLPLVVVGWGTRYHTGPWRGGALVLVSSEPGGWNPFSADGRALQELIQWIDSPMVTGAGFDYPLVRPGEEARLLIEAVVRHDDARAFEFDVVLRSADGKEVARSQPLAPVRERGRGFLDSLRAIVRFEGRRWPRPYMVAEVRLRHGREVTASGQGLTALWEPSVLRRSPPSAVTGRRLVVHGSAEPVLGASLERPWYFPGGLPAPYDDLVAWNATLARLADAGVHLVRLESAMALGRQTGEFERRLDAALVTLADAHGVAIELQPVINEGKALLLDDLADPRIVPSLFLSAATPTGLSSLSEQWPVSRVVAVPLTVATGHITPEAEAKAGLGVRPVRIASPGGELDLSATMEAVALGVGGTLLNSKGLGLAPRTLETMSAARLVTRLLQPNAHQPSIVVVSDTPNATPLIERLSRVPVDWGPCLPAGISDLPPLTSAIAVDQAGTLDDTQRRTLIARARRGARVLSTDRTLLSQPARATRFGEISRQAQGYTGWLDVSRPDAVGEAVAWMGVPRLVSEETLPEGPFRVVRNRCPGGEFLVVTVSSPEPQRVSLRLGSYTVNVGVSHSQPAVAAFGGSGPWLVWSVGPALINGMTWMTAPDDAYILLASQLGDSLPTARALLGFAQYQGELDLRLRRDDHALECETAYLRDGALREFTRSQCHTKDGWVHIELEERCSGLPFAVAPAERLEQVRGRIESLLR